MTKKELALQYWDGPLPNDEKYPVRRLMYWIRGNADLMRELESSGYRSNQRLFTQKQIKIIYKYLGEP